MESDPKRRQVLGWLGGVSAAAVVGGCARPESTAPADPPGPDRGASADAPPPTAATVSGPAISALGELTDGEAKVVEHDGDPVVLVRQGDQVKAFSAKCTHKDCVVKWQAAQKQLVCPCHKSAFDLTGKALSGPAKKPLAPLPATVRNGQVHLG